MKLSKTETAFYVFVIASGFALLGFVVYTAVSSSKNSSSNKFLSNE